MPNQASAAFQIRYSTNGGATFSAPVNDNGPGDNNLTLGTIDINVGGLNITAHSGGSTAPDFTLVDLQVQSSGRGPTAAGRVIVQVTMDGLQTAPPPQILINSFTNNSLPVGSATGTTRFWIDSADGLFTTSGGSIVLDSGTLAPHPATAFAFSAVPTYSITQQIDVTYAARSSLGFDSNTTIVTPAPAGLIAAISGIPVLGFGTWIRRRRNQVAA